MPMIYFKGYERKLKSWKGAQFLSVFEGKEK